MITQIGSFRRLYDNREFHSAKVYCISANLCSLNAHPLMSIFFSGLTVTLSQIQFHEVA